MATNYDIDYNDKRFTEVENDKSAAINESNEMYDDMISNSDSFYQSQINAAKEYAETQKKNQQAATDFAIEEINQQKAQAKSDYLKEQSGAYTDWQKQSGAYGANAEQMAASGLRNTGYSESSQVSMYNQYQNRVATAREAFQRAVLNYNNAITEARLQNNAALAEIAYQALQQQLELSLAGFQYKNTLLLDKADKKRTIDQMYYQRYQDVLKQINTENTLKEQIRQYNESMAFQREQFEYQKAQAAAKSVTLSGGGSSSGGTKGNGKIAATGSIAKGVATANKESLIKAAQAAKISSASEAIAFLKKNGISNGGLPVLERSEWVQGKKNEGSENSSEFQYASYNAYLAGYVTWCIQNS